MDHLLATYRLQLHSGFRLAEVESLVPYFDGLGVTHLYLSPLLRARSGSAHGYDVVDPTELDPKLGSEADLGRLADTLARYRMGLVLDIVPNHMATGSENRFWEDVLTHGRSSEYATWFDIDWGPPKARRPYRIFLPVLGDRLARVLERGELTLSFSNGRFRIHYFDNSFPTDPATAPLLLGAARLSLQESQPGSADDLRQMDALLTDLRTLPPRSAAGAGSERRRRSDQSCARLQSLYDRSPEIRSLVDTAVAIPLSGRSDASRQVRQLLAVQPYRLAYWRRAAREINYRRFFTISHLVALRAEDPHVFARTHATILDWIGRGWVDGLRIDHIDGLLDPGGYLRTLRDAVQRRLESRGEARATDSQFPVFVEKILARDETLPSHWPAAGTTGYDFLAQLEDLFLDADGFRAIEAAYRKFIGKRVSYREIAYRCKREVLEGPLAAESRRLGRLLQNLAARCGVEDRPPQDQLRQALVEVISALPIYRTYFDAGRRSYSEREREILRGAIAAAGERGRARRAALDLTVCALLLDENHHALGAVADHVEFIQRFQQTCVPSAAKAIEDTAFYRYIPLVSRNEVGSDPGVPLERPVLAFHAANSSRSRSSPRSMLTVSTHDTKRSADVRARLDLLSELPDEWRARLRRWHRWNRRHRTRIRVRYAPDANTEYLLYQTLVGVWPLPAPEGEDRPPGAEVTELLRERVEGYMLKAVREAGQQTSWVDPKPPIEAALRHFVQQLLSAEASPRFLTDLRGFVGRIARPGLWNSLARTLLLLSSPGTPDLYQGDELWNFSLVDPDNRRPVDFQLRRRLLAGLSARFDAGGDERRRLLQELLDRPEDGRIKLHVVRQGLRARNTHPALFQEGEYLPLMARGSAAEHVVAFARRHGTKAAITIVPRRVFGLAGESSSPPLGSRLWSDTAVTLPADLGAGGVWRCELNGLETGPRPGPLGPELALAEVLSVFPLAFLLK